MGFCNGYVGGVAAGHLRAAVGCRVAVLVVPKRVKLLVYLGHKGHPAKCAEHKGAAEDIVSIAGLNDVIVRPHYLLIYRVVLYHHFFD